MSKDGLKFSKIDRFLVCRNFVSLQPNSTVTALHKFLSDHSPVILAATQTYFGPRPFRFFNSWLLEADFESFLLNTWSSFRGFGHSDQILAAKFRFLKNALKKWRISKLATQAKEIEQLKVKVHEIESRAECGLVSGEEILERRNGLIRLRDLEHFRLLDLKQKAKINWLVDGDENSKFFHGVLKNNYKKNSISGLSINGTWCTDPQSIKNEALEFFRKKFFDLWPHRPKLISPLFSSLSEDQLSSLEAPFSISEIKNAIWACGNDKAPGPDGFTFKLLKTHWDVFKNDIRDAVKHFEACGSFAPGCNSSFITLVPKVKDPITLADYRPISLIGCIYKIVAKTLALRLKGVIGELVDSVQSAYIEGRNILDGPLIMNEICSWARKTKKKMFVFKADFEKAFDSVNWGFLDSLMQQMGFGAKWRAWIHGCLSSAKASILVNGSPTGEFQLMRGVRQGDPLSPFLFILAMEGLNVAIKGAVGKRLLKGVNLPNNGPTLSHLFYADDAIFLGDWDRGSAENLARILKCFEVVSGLKVNFQKSRVFGICASPEEVKDWACILGCLTDSLPFIYLGVPVGANMKNKKHWKPIIDKFQVKLSSWKSKALSFGGRATLVKAVLGCLPSYYLSLFRAPVGIIDVLEKYRRKFLWGGSDEGKKIHWVSWDRVIASKSDGGLGIGSIASQNSALLFKWVWRFFNEENAVWSQVIRSIHNLGGRPKHYLAKKSLRGVLADLVGLLNKYIDDGLIPKSTFQVKLGCGSRILFWKDLWIGDQCLQSRFPTLYLLEKVKNCAVRDRFSNAGLVWDWKRRPCSDSELGELWNLTRMLGNVCLLSSADRMDFSLSPNGVYLVASLRKFIDSKLACPIEPIVCWLKGVPFKVSCFIWRASFGRIPVAASLISRGVCLPSAVCKVCSEEVESVDHALVSCWFARGVRRRIFDWCKIPPPSYSKVVDLLNFGASWGNCPKKRKRFIIILYCMLWCIWRARNARIFSNLISSPSLIADEVMSTSYSWLIHRSKGVSIRSFDWNCSPFSLL